MTVEFEDEALAEIENAISYSEGRFGTGERLSREIQSSILRIAEDPFRFRKNHLGVCIHHLPPFPCYLVFEPRKNPARTPGSSGYTPWETPPAVPTTGSPASRLFLEI